jgi:hypothetical protein
VRAAALENGDGIKPLIAEIRSRTEELVARELTLRERERDLERQFRLLCAQNRQAAPNEWLDIQERLRQRSAELDAQALDLAARTARLKESEERLLDRQTALEQTRRELSDQAGRARNRHDTFLKLRASDHETLRQRIARIRQREQDIENRIRLAHADIVRQRQDLERQRNELHVRVQACEDAEGHVRARRDALQRDFVGLEQQAASLAAQQRELQVQRHDLEVQQAEIAQSRMELTEMGRALEQQHRELEQHARSLEAETASSQEQRGDAARELNEICAQRAALIKQQAEHDQRARRLSDYEEQLRARAATLETETACLAETEARIEARRQELQTQTQFALEEAQQQREDALALREQVEAREAEARQRQLAAELELQELAAQRTALESSQRESDERRTREEGRLERARAVLAEQAAAVQAAERSWLVRPGRWWLRTAVLALLGGSIAGLAWWWSERPLYEADTELRLPAGAEPKWAAAHEQRLRAPDLIAGVLGSDGLSQAWQKLRQAGQLRIEAAPDVPVIRVAGRGPQPESLARVMTAVAEGYAAQSGAGIVSAEAADTLAQLEAEHITLEARARELQEKQTGRQSILATLATGEQRDQARAASDKLRAEYQARGKALLEAQSRLADMENAPAPRGNVLPVDYENSLLADEMYQADLKEFRAAVVEYRSELKIALLLLSDPLKNLQASVQGLAGVVAEQRTLQPPPPVEAVLEQFESDLDAFQKHATEFMTEWRTGTEAIDDLGPELPLAELLGQQVTAADKARQFCGEANDFESGLRGRLDQFTKSSEGATREVVVLAVLRSELAKLNAANAELNQAADGTDVTKNFRLDALDRQLRGLQSRLERRQASVRQLLQFEADEKARREQVEQTSALRQKVQELEQGRERLIREFTSGIDELRRLEDEVVQRTVLTAEAERAAAQLERCQARLAQIDHDSEAAQHAGMLPPVQASPVRVAMVAGEHRVRNAALAGLATLAGIFAVSLLSVVRNPLRRGRDWEAALKPASPACGPAASPQEHRA